MPLSEVLWPDTPFKLEDNLVLVGRRGSEAHGTYIPSTEPGSIDDRDLMGIAIPPAKYYYGLSHWEGQDSFKGQWDVVLYEYRKFVSLLMKQNPNVLGMLWLEPEDYLAVAPQGRILIQNRNLFRCRKLAADSFAGYAISQLKKMENCAFKGYMGDKRKKLVEKYGYDTKNAAHLVRLLHMGIEYLNTGELQVKRTKDRDMLIAIKQGKYTLKAIKRYTEKKMVEFRKAEQNSCLPETLDKEAIEAIVVETLGKVLR